MYPKHFKEFNSPTQSMKPIRFFPLRSILFHFLELCRLMTIFSEAKTKEVPFCVVESHIHHLSLVCWHISCRNRGEMSEAKHDEQMVSQSNFGFQRPSIGFRFRSVEKRLRREALNFFVDYFCLKSGVHLKEFLENLERNIIIKALSRHNGNQKQTAEYLGLKYTTLNEKVKKYHIHFLKQPSQEAVWSESAD